MDIFGQIFGESACCEERAFVSATPRDQRPQNHVHAFSRDHFIEVEVQRGGKSKNSLHDRDLYPGKNHRLPPRVSESDTHCLDDFWCSERVDDRASETRWRQTITRASETDAMTSARDRDLMPKCSVEQELTPPPKESIESPHKENLNDTQSQRAVISVVGEIPEGSALAAQRTPREEKTAPPASTEVHQHFHFTVQNKDKAQKNYDKVKREFAKVQKETLAARSIQLGAPRKYGEKDKASEELQEIHNQKRKYEEWKAKYDEASEVLEVAKFEQSRAKRLLDMHAHTLPAGGLADTESAPAPGPLATITSRKEALRRRFARAATPPRSASAGPPPSPTPPDRDPRSSHPAARAPSPMLDETHTVPPRLNLQPQQEFLNAEARRPVVPAYLHSDPDPDPDFILSDDDEAPAKPSLSRASSLPPRPSDRGTQAGGASGTSSIANSVTVTPLPSARTGAGAGGGLERTGSAPREQSRPPWFRWNADAKEGREPLPAGHRDRSAYPPQIRPVQGPGPPGRLKGLQATTRRAGPEEVKAPAGSALEAAGLMAVEVVPGRGPETTPQGHLAGGAQVVL